MKVIIRGASIAVINRCALAEGNDNSLCTDFEFSSEWDSLTKRAVFANGDTAVSVPLSTDTCPIPWEVLANAGELYVALRGTADGGTVVYCTQNAFLGHVPPSLAAAIADEHREKTPDVLDALEERVTALEGCGGGVGGYEPPVGGIPKADLASDVQASLGKADTALQSDDTVEGETVELADVAASGDYNDLINKPAIPTVPQNVSAFTNDSGYLTLSTLPKYDGGVE